MAGDLRAKSKTPGGIAMTVAKHAVVAAALIVTSLSPALASSHYEMTYHDTIRPNGHPRSDKIYNAALDYCYRQTGLSRNDADTAAFKACMKTRGYRWLSTKLVQDAQSVAPRKTSPRNTAQDDGGFIDPDTGMVCHNTGFASICDPPQGTVHYTNPHGLNCTRTGIVAVCTSF
jgi:hypothetical protein